MGLAVKYSYWSLAIGGSIGHALATGLAVLCGRIIGHYCSEKCINYFGGLIFLGFGVYSVAFEILLVE